LAAGVAGGSGLSDALAAATTSTHTVNVTRSVVRMRALGPWSADQRIVGAGFGADHLGILNHPSTNRLRPHPHLELDGQAFARRAKRLYVGIEVTYPPLAARRAVPPPQPRARTRWCAADGTPIAIRSSRSYAR